jgi:hypothetical protein
VAAEIHVASGMTRLAVPSIHSADQIAGQEHGNSEDHQQDQECPPWKIVTWPIGIVHNDFPPWNEPGGESAQIPARVVPDLPAQPGVLAPATDLTVGANSWRAIYST